MVVEYRYFLCCKFTQIDIQDFKKNRQIARELIVLFSNIF